MKVLLLQDVDNLGLAGEVTKVAAGYGRNYLLPQGMAVLATPSAMKQAEAVRRAGELRRAQEKEDALAIANQINDAVLVFERRAGERDKLYGSVTVGDIATAINTKFGLDISKRRVALAEPIRALGEYDIAVKLMVEVAAHVKAVVINEGEVYDPSAAPVREVEVEADAEEEPVAEAAE